MPPIDSLPDDLLYLERLNSKRTLLLFGALFALFSGLAAWRLSVHGLAGWGLVYLILAGIFLFHTLNYRILVITLGPDTLTLKFGLLRWRIPLANIAACKLDSLPAFKRFGGAGVHFMFIDGRYRASFNFLEYPRVVVALKRKAGPVRDISFSTRRPEELIRLIESTALAQEKTE